MGVVLWEVPVLIICDDSRATAAQWVVSQTGAKSYSKRVWSRNVLMSTAGPAAGAAAGR